MTRTREEIKQIATDIVNMMVADIMYEHPAVQKAVAKILEKPWIESIDQLTETVSDILLNKFGCSD